MTAGAPDTIIESASGSDAGDAGWRTVRDDADLQFAPVDFPPPAPPKPNAFEQFVQWLFEALGELLAPLAEALGISWGWLQWVLLGLVGLFVGGLLWRLIMGSQLWAGAAHKAGGDAAADWAPSAAATLALLEDADRLAAEGRYDEATHLLLQRSVGQIAAARPQWVEPSTTARELARLTALPEAARIAFAVMAERVERSLFALRSLDRGDWEAARAAYAEFALARLDRRESALGSAA